MTKIKHQTFSSKQLLWGSRKIIIQSNNYTNYYTLANRLCQRQHFWWWQNHFVDAGACYHHFYHRVYIYQSVCGIKMRERTNLLKYFWSIHPIFVLLSLFFAHLALLGHRTILCMKFLIANRHFSIVNRYFSNCKLILTNCK